MLGFWEWVALSGLALTALGVIVGGLAIVQSVRQTQAITGHIGATTQLIAGAEERTQRILQRMETNAEARYRDLKDHLEGDTDAR
jgi:hypothetical protein